MIHITQGHEKSISFEVLFKSLSKFSQLSLKNICLHFSPKSIEENLKHLNIEFKIKKDSIILAGKEINLQKISNDVISESMSSLLNAQKNIKENDILITMPTTKDQILLNGKQYAGHTDYFRKEVNEDATMLFKYKNTYVLLASDHIPLCEVANIEPKNYFNRLDRSINSLINIFSFEGEIYFSGLNPHAGEDGLLGKEEHLFQESLNRLCLKYKCQNNTFIPADTIHYLHNKQEEQLFVYFYHDQSLTFFKNTFGLFGINITLNLPFLRFSVDHGTAFNLYSKNSANFLGSYYVINEALKIHER